MATMRCRQTEEEPTNQADNTRNAQAETDWRRMTEGAHNTIARWAYGLYEGRGYESGHELDDWLTAEHEVQVRRSAE